MHLLISDTFTDSFAKLTGDEQKSVKTTVFDLQLNPANPGMQFHRIDRARDANFWSVRVSRDIRLIVHKTNSSLMLCYVDHHDKAYRWAEERKLEKHPKTGAVQWVKIQERIKEITVPKYVEEVVTEQPDRELLFADIPTEELLQYGVPEEWVEEVRQADEDALLDLADQLPDEAAEALLELAVGGKPKPRPVETEKADPFDHPDSRRRFRIMENVDELERALEWPWEKWTIFLHPAQRHVVEKEYSGPARISGSAGTGKTVVALHRAVWLARNRPDTRILLATFSETLADQLRTKLRRLIHNEPRIGERLEVHSMNAVGERLYEIHFGKPRPASCGDIRSTFEEIMSGESVSSFSISFLMSEWEQVVDAWQIETWAAYRDVMRLGRKTRLPEKQREQLWSVFVKVRQKLHEKGLITHAELFQRLARHLSDTGIRPYDTAVIDEAQDISVSQLRFLAAMGGDRPDSLFFAGDLGQRIFQPPFSWKALGVDIRGRSHVLRINYRTSHQIRMQADRLLGPEISDVDGITEDRRGTVSVFNGPKPVITLADSAEAEQEFVSRKLEEWIEQGILPHEIGVFVRSADELERAKTAVDDAGLACQVLDDDIGQNRRSGVGSMTSTGKVSICTMHLAKGLEFRAVVVMACDDEIIPLQSRIESVTDESDLEEVYNTERHLLYVACTRARDQLLVTGVEPGSEFLEDMG